MQEMCATCVGFTDRSDCRSNKFIQHRTCETGTCYIHTFTQKLCTTLKQINVCKNLFRPVSVSCKRATRHANLHLAVVFAGLRPSRKPRRVPLLPRRPLRLPPSRRGPRSRRRRSWAPTMRSRRTPRTTAKVRDRQTNHSRSFSITSEVFTIRTHATSCVPKPSHRDRTPPPHTAGKKEPRMRRIKEETLGTEWNRCELNEQPKRMYDTLNAYSRGDSNDYYY